MRVTLLLGLGLGLVFFAVQVRPSEARAATSASPEQEAYYHMHQASEFLELLQKGKCPTAQTEVDSHLRSANHIFDQVPSSPLEPLFRKLIHVRNAVIRGDGSKMTHDLDTIRELVREVADHEELTHQSQWHVELSVCSRH